MRGRKRGAEKRVKRSSLLKLDKYEVGDLVWARMKGFPAWPSKVVENPSGHIKPHHHYIFFFGSYDYAWIGEEHIYPYYENISSLSKKSKQKDYRDGIIAIAKAYQESLAEKEQAGTSTQSEDVEMCETVQIADYRKVITKEVVILLKRCDE